MEKLDVSVKRARNMIWNAAGDYRFDPVFLAASGNEDINLYLNMVVGLVHKWLDPVPVEGLLRNMDAAPSQEACEAAAWISLEQAAWVREREERPAMDELRRAWAEAEVRLTGDLPKRTSADRIQAARYLAILGRPPVEKLTAREQEFLSALLDAADLDGEGLTNAVRQAIRAFYHVDLSHGYTRKKWAQRWELTNWVVLDHRVTSLVRSPERAGEGGLSAAAGKGPVRGRLSRRRDPDQVRDRIRRLYGEPLLDGARLQACEERFCAGLHAGCHLYYIDGDRRPPESGPAAREKNGLFSGFSGRALDQQAARLRSQQGKNEAFYERDRLQYQSQIRKLSAMIRNEILTLQADEFLRDRTGRVDPARAWRGAVLRDPRIFLRRETKLGGDLCVTLLLDASSSQLDHQEVIASEAYILAESLRLNEIDTQIWAFSSADGFTILDRLKKLSEGKTASAAQDRGVFRYGAMGCNRDGLALRAIQPFLDRTRYPYNLLLVLTDASPNDDDTVPISGKGFQTRTYAGHDAVSDTAGEVHRLRKAGIRLAGIVYGQDDAVMSARDIYGSGFVRIHSLSRLARAAGGFIQREIHEIYQGK